MKGWKINVRVLETKNIYISIYIFFFGGGRWSLEDKILSRSKIRLLQFSGKEQNNVYTNEGLCDDEKCLYNV